MEQIGVRLDTERLHEISERVKPEADGLERRSTSWPGRSSRSGSPRQLEEILFGKLGLSRKRRGKTGYSTDARVLQAIRSEHEIIPKIERWRELTKLAQTYLDALPLLVDADSRCTRRSTRPRRRPGGCRPTTPTCRTSRSGRRSDERSAPASSRHPATSWCRPTIRRWSCGCSPTSPARTCSRRSSAAARTSIRRPPAGCSTCEPDQIDPAHAVEVEDDQLRDRVRPVRVRDGRSARHPAGGGGRVHRALHVRVPRGRAVHRGDDRAGHRARLRVDAVRAPAPGAGAARAPLGPAQAGRAIRGQHGDPGDRRGHHEGRDGPLRQGPDRGRAEQLGWCCRSTTSCCSKGPRPRPSRSGRSPSGRWPTPTRSIRRWRSRRASATTGYRRSSCGCIQSLSQIRP